MGQRDIVWTRVSKSGFARGLRLRHYGEILHAKLISDYPAIVDKVKVTLITDAAEVEKRLILARAVYDERNRRLENMTDESVDTFYSCLLCQSFAPNHVCIITPERLGLCGAYNWLDGKAAYEIDETGPNQPVRKGDLIDSKRGVWAGINDYVFTNSHKSIESFTAYSIMDRPMTSCGCFEAICAYLPECNGIMIVNREYMGETPVGMTFSSLAGTVGGGQQTPGFMGCGKVFLTSRKFLYADGGHARIVWMPKQLKELLANDLKKRCEEQGVPDLLEKIADESITVEALKLREYMEKVHHPALAMEDMSCVATGVSDATMPTTAPVVTQPPMAVSPTASSSTSQPDLNAATIATPAVLELLKQQITADVTEKIKENLTRTIVMDIISTLSSKFIGGEITLDDRKSVQSSSPIISPALSSVNQKSQSASEIITAITAFEIKKDKCETAIWEVTLGATKAQGGTRGKSLKVGGQSCMPFHLWEGAMPNRPVIAMEVFDSISEKYPAVLRDIYGKLIDNPAEMAKVCVEKYGADCISVRLDGTHPERGNRSPLQAVDLVKSVLQAVDVPLIITGHNNFDKINEVMKAVAQACAGENLLFNWVEQDNYRTIAGAAMAYGHSIVSMAPIDVNISKQMVILLTNMDLKLNQIIMDPMTGAMGYGIEYTHSVMERIRLTALGGDKMLAGPMIVSPGQECAKIKEFKAPEKDFPAWGELKQRAAIWEASTAIDLLYAGADVMIMYHPQAVAVVKKTIVALMDGS